MIQKAIIIVIGFIYMCVSMTKHVVKSHLKKIHIYINVYSFKSNSVNEHMNITNVHDFSKTFGV